MSTTDEVGQIRRFLVVGAANTAVTVVLLALLSLVIDPAIAYTVVYALGLAFTTVMTNHYVFAAERSWPRRAMFVVWYLAVYGVGLAVVRLLDAGHQWSAFPLALATVAVTAPLSFIGGRLIFSRPAAPPTHRHQEPSR